MSRKQPPNEKRYSLDMSTREALQKALSKGVPNERPKGKAKHPKKGDTKAEPGSK